jgi:hypothetical protein
MARASYSSSGAGGILKGQFSRHSSGSKARDYSGCWPQTSQVRSSPGRRLGGPLSGFGLSFGFFIRDYRPQKSVVVNPSGVWLPDAEFLNHVTGSIDRGTISSSMGGLGSYADEEEIDRVVLFQTYIS